MEYAILGGSGAAKTIAEHISSDERVLSYALRDANPIATAMCRHRSLAKKSGRSNSPAVHLLGHPVPINDEENTWSASRARLLRSLYPFNR